LSAIPLVDADGLLNRHGEFPPLRQMKAQGRLHETRMQQRGLGSHVQSSVDPVQSLVSSLPRSQHSKHQWLLGWELERELQPHWHGYDVQREQQWRLIRPQRPQRCAESDMHSRAHIHARSPGSGIGFDAMVRLKPLQPPSLWALRVCCWPRASADCRDRQSR
jgi:hypothetical protein